MSASLGMVNPLPQSAETFETSTNQVMSTHGAGMETFNPSQVHDLGRLSNHTSIPGDRQFADYDLPINDASTHHLSLDTSPNLQMIYNRDMTEQAQTSELQGSVPSVNGGRASFSSNAPLSHVQLESADGSDDASPGNSHRTTTASDQYGDDLGIGSSGAIDGSDLGMRSRDGKDEPSPAWTELKTKAGKERKRLPLACIACRRKKIRCSGEKPACKHCLRSRIPCVYKVTARKAAPRTDYMAMLDKRLKRMEERIIKIVPKEEVDQTTVIRAQVKPAIPGTTVARSANNKKRPADEAFGPELEAWARSNAASESGLAGPLLQQETEETRLLSEGADALPSKEIQEHLCEVFFDNLYGQAYHLLHKPSFMRKLRAGKVPPVLILAVCAVSSRFSTHPKLSTNPAFLRGEAWASEARDIVMRRYEWPNITILTCLILLGLHEFGTCYGGRSWALCGMAIRMAYALQLHRDLDHDPTSRHKSTPLSFIDKEIRRRTMWACFLMDRFNSSGTGRPMTVREETIKIQLPVKEKLFQLDMEGRTENLNGRVPDFNVSGGDVEIDVKDNMGVAAYMIKAMALWGRVIIYLFQGGREKDPHEIWAAESQYTDLERQAEAFQSSLPASLRYIKENLDTHESEGLANQFLFLHIATQQNLLFLNYLAVQGHPGGRPPVNTPREFVAKNTTRAFEAGKRISELLRDAESHAIVAPFVGYCAFLSSTVQMAAAFSKNTSIETIAKKNLATNVRYLAKMKRFWGTFHWTSENLKEQFRACADAAKNGPRTDGSRAPASVFQYGDWFDRYPHGVSQSDFEDPATVVKQEKGDDAVLEQKTDYHTVEEFFSTLSPAQSAQEAQKQSRRKPSRKSISNPAPHLTTNMRGHHAPPDQPMSLHPTMSQTPYDIISPTNVPPNIFGQPSYYGQDLLFAPSQQGMLPQLDRQLVFGAYAGMDPSNQHHHQMSSHPQQSLPNDLTSWDMSGQMNDGAGMMAGFGVEPTSAWFMPFNMEPPEMSPEETFASMGAHMNFNMGGMPLGHRSSSDAGRGGGGAPGGM